MSSNTSNSQQALTSRACLANLPTEVKTRIAKMCWRQDEWWRDYNEHLKKQFGTAWSFNQELLTLQSYVAAPYGRSLGTLSLLSREWDEVTAPYRFRRGSHIREIVFDHSDENSLMIFLGYAFWFANVSKITIAHRQFVKFSSKALRPAGLFGETHVGRSALVRLLNQVTSLHHEIPEINLPETFSITCANLVFLRLCFDPTSSINSQVNTVLEKSPHLLHLELNATHGTLALSPTSTNDKAWPRLQSLKLVAHRVEPSTIDFLVAFAATLERLDVTWARSPDEGRGQSMPTFTFPSSSTFTKLSHMALRHCNADALGAVAESVLPTVLPALQDFHFCPHSDDLEFEEDFLYDLQMMHRRFLPSFRLRYWYEDRYLRGFPTSMVLEYFGENSSATTTPVTPYPHSAIVDPDDFAQDGESEPFEGPVRNAVSFLVDWHERVIASNDAEEYARLARALRTIELERVAQQC